MSVNQIFNKVGSSKGKIITLNYSKKEYEIENCESCSHKRKIHPPFFHLNIGVSHYSRNQINVFKPDVLNFLVKNWINLDL